MSAPRALFELAPESPDPIILACPGGQVIRTSRGKDGLATATFDIEERYRYRLSRVWDPGKPRCAWVMLNPSTATELKRDPTVTRVYRYALRWGFGSFEVLNLHAFRTTYPKELKLAADPTGPYCDQVILAGCQAAQLVVCAWGAHGTYLDRGTQVYEMLQNAGIPLYALSRTIDGQPGHPLRLAKDLSPVRWKI